MCCYVVAKPVIAILWRNQSRSKVLYKLSLLQLQPQLQMREMSICAVEQERNICLVQFHLQGIGKSTAILPMTMEPKDVTGQLLTGQSGSYN